SPRTALRVAVLLHAAQSSRVLRGSSSPSGVLGERGSDIRAEKCPVSVGRRKTRPPPRGVRARVLRLPAPSLLPDVKHVHELATISVAPVDLPARRHPPSWRRPDLRGPADSRTASAACRRTTLGSKPLLMC